MGEAGICKRLDRFLLSDHLLPILAFYRSWDTPSDVSYHYPIFLEWGPRLASQCYPIKFNRAWLLEDDFALLVSSSWNSPMASGHTNFLDTLAQKLGRLKGTVKEWEKIMILTKAKELT